MPIDLNLLRAFKGGLPDLVKLSQTRRFANPALVDIIVEEGCYIVFINEAGIYNISYDLNTDVLSIEAINN